MPRQKPPPDAVSARFREIRGQLTGTEVQRKCGIDRGTWSNYENGKKRPDWLSLEKLSIAFDVSPTWLLFEHGPKKLSELKRQNVTPLQGTLAAEIAARFGTKRRDGSGKKAIAHKEER